MTPSHRPRVIAQNPGGNEMEGLEGKVIGIIGEQLACDKDSLVPEANLLDDLGADSLDVVELVMALEEAFAIEVPDEDAESIRTISDIVSYVEQRVENAA